MAWNTHKMQAIVGHSLADYSDELIARTAPTMHQHINTPPASAWLGAEADRTGRIRVGPDLSVPGHPNIFAIGDTALSLAWDGLPVPGLAPAAKQGGAYVASVLRARLRGRKLPPFRYRHQGSLATIGRRSAVADFGRVKVTGAAAWWLWGAVHVLFSGRRTQSAFGHARLDLVLLYVRRRSTADHANRSGSIRTHVPWGELDGKVSGLEIGVSCHRCSRADEMICIRRSQRKPAF
jgi:hypothetical protein